VVEHRLEERLTVEPQGFLLCIPALNSLIVVYCLLKSSIQQCVAQLTVSGNLLFAGFI